MEPLAEFGGDRIRAVPAGPADAATVQACLDAAPDYHARTQGGPAAPDAAARLLWDAEADAQRRVYLLVPAASPAGGRGQALGVLDLYLHQPEPGVAHVGLLLLREAVQGRGLGRELAEALARALEAAGFSALRLSVGDENPGARAFWDALGFEPAGRLAGGITVLERRLG